MRNTQIGQPAKSVNRRPRKIEFIHRLGFRRRRQWGRPFTVAVFRYRPLMAVRA